MIRKLSPWFILTLLLGLPAVFGSAALLLALPAPVHAETPSISIDIPLPGETVSPVEIVVVGKGQALPDNGVIVEAVDAGGRLLDQQRTTLVAPPDGAGEWRATLHPRVTPGTQGFIRAHALPSPEGLVVADVGVDVIFGSPQAPTAEPPTDTPEPPTATPEPPTPTKEPPTPTKEPATPTSEPSTPTKEAPTVTPLTPTKEPTALPTRPASISISLPRPNEMVNPQELVVTGQGSALPENNVVVQVLDADGRVLDQQAATVSAPLGGSGPWQATMHPNAVPGAKGRVYAFAQSPADGSTVAQATVYISFGHGPLPPPTPTATAPATATPRPTTAPPFLSINVPASGQTVSPVDLLVVGMGAALPANNVVVQVLDANGRVLDQQAVVVAAPLGGSGEWRATLRPNAVPGSPGRVRAYAPSPANGAVLAQAIVNIRFGHGPLPPTAVPTPTFTPTPTPAAQPSLLINIPLAGEVVSPYEVVAAGAGSALPENNVIVQALDAAGRILDQQYAIVAAPVGGAGGWRVVLHPNVAPGSPGQIYAFSTSPADGSILAQDRVNVVYGTAPTPPPPASLTIDAPADGASVNTTQGFTVRGRAQGLFEGNVVVRVRDNLGRTLAEQATTAGNGRWSTNFQFSIASGTFGSIYAFSPSPVNGQPMADDLVHVIFVSSCKVRTDWPIYYVQPGDNLYTIAARTDSTVGELVTANCLTNPNLLYVGQPLRVPALPGNVVVKSPAVSIDSPAGGAALTANVPFAVSGTATEVLSGTLYMRVIDPTGKVLVETQAQLIAGPNANGAWQWSAAATVPDAPPGMHATIFAYAQAPSDGSITAAAALPVVFAGQGAPTYITIDAPLPYSRLDISKPIRVTGHGRGLFENTVVVQAIDGSGNVLSTVPTIVQTQEVGGAGVWSADLPVNLVTRGRIRAFAESPMDGSLMAEAAVDVQFGDPQSLPSYVTITYPLPGAIYSSQNTWGVVMGYAGGLSADTFYLMLQNESGSIVRMTQVQVDPRTGFWWFATPLHDAAQHDGSYTLRALAAAPDTGAPEAADQLPVRTQRHDALVSGRVTTLVRSALPPDAVVTVAIVDLSAADPAAPTAQLGVQMIPTNGSQPPIPFAVGYNTAEVKAKAAYGLVASIADSTGRRIFTTQQPMPIPLQGGPIAGIDIVVQPAP